MKKIKSVKFKAAIPVRLIYRDNYWWLNDLKWSPENVISFSDLFEVEYEQEYFEISPKYCQCKLNGNSEIHYTEYNSDYYIYGNAGTLQEIEYRKMYWQTMFYFRKLAEHLNGDWDYEEAHCYAALVCGSGEFVLVRSFSNSYLYPVIKFNPTIKTKQITDIAKPEMLENYKKICNNQY